MKIHCNNGKDNTKPRIQGDGKQKRAGSYCFYVGKKRGSWDCDSQKCSVKDISRKTVQKITHWQ